MKPAARADLCKLALEKQDTLGYRVPDRMEELKNPVA